MLAECSRSAGCSSLLDDVVDDSLRRATLEGAVRVALALYIPTMHALNPSDARLD